MRPAFPDASFGANGLVLGSESLVDITNGALLGPFYARMRLGIDDLGRAVVAARDHRSPAAMRTFVSSASPGMARRIRTSDLPRAASSISTTMWPCPGRALTDIPTAISIERGRIVFGTISIRDEQRHMVTLALTANHLFADSFETN